MKISPLKYVTGFAKTHRHNYYAHYDKERFLLPIDSSANK